MKSPEIDEIVKIMNEQKRPLGEIAETVSSMRSADKGVSRSAMNSVEASRLNASESVKDFTYYCDYYHKKFLSQGIVPTNEQIYEEIIKASTRKDPEINTLLGIKSIY